MATQFQTIYDAFLSKVEADEWMMDPCYQDEAVQDWKKLLEGAVFHFRYPRISLDYNEDGFVEDLTNDEIQILATYMKLEWVRRCIANWDNLRQLYSDKDFGYSGANFLDKLDKTDELLTKEVRSMIDKYGRSAKYKPDAIFGKLAGK